MSNSDVGDDGGDGDGDNDSYTTSTPTTASLNTGITHWNIEAGSRQIPKHGHCLSLWFTP